MGNRKNWLIAIFPLKLQFLDQNKHVNVKYIYVKMMMNHGMGEAPKRCHRSSKEPAVFGPDRLHLLRYWLRFFLLHLR
jgi:hypothetical protein